MTSVTVTTTYLQMLDPGHLRPRRWTGGGWRVRQAPREIAINRDFYRAAGRDWQWLDRLAWDDARWQAYVEQPGLETWIGYLGDDAIGYFELDPRPKLGVEIAYFGLLPAYLGRGLGGVLLSEAIARAWQIQQRRVWVHTCTLDHPRALANYLARGLEIYDRKTELQQIVPGSAMPDAVP